MVNLTESLVVEFCPAKIGATIVPSVTENVVVVVVRAYISICHGSLETSTITLRKPRTL